MLQRLSKIVAAYRAGAITEGWAITEIILLAAETDAELVFANLPPDLQARLARDVADREAADTVLIESVCAPDPATYATDAKRRQGAIVRGHRALQQILRKGPSGS